MTSSETTSGRATTSGRGTLGSETSGSDSRQGPPSSITGLPARSPIPSVYPRPPSSVRRPGTATAASERPLTSRKGTGYRERRERTPGARKGSAGESSATSEEEQREQELRKLETELRSSLEEISLNFEEGDVAKALVRAQETARQGEKLRDLCENGDVLGAGLYAAASLALALALERSGMETEAMQTYASRLSDKSFPDTIPLRVNLGNLHFRRTEYAKAVKMYRMAVDKVPESQRRLKRDISKNIAAALLKMGRVRQAVDLYQELLEQRMVDAEILGDLMLCYARLRDAGEMQKLFSKTLRLSQEVRDTESLSGSDGVSGRKARRELSRVLVACANEIAARGNGPETLTLYDWCTEELRRCGYSDAAQELQLAKADALACRHRLDAASQIYTATPSTDNSPTPPTFRQGMEKGASSADVTKRLACLLSMEDEVVRAERYALLSTATDRYDATSWVNKGSLHLRGGELDRAQRCYEEALRLDPEHVEALFNVGLTFKRRAAGAADARVVSESLDSAEGVFRRIHSERPEFAAAILQLGHLCELRQRFEEAIDWFELVHSLVPQDPGIMSKLGALHFTLGDESKAVSYYQESYESFPGDMDVLCWLAAFYVNNEMYETGAQYFRRAAKLQPGEIKWSLMTASCYRRAGLLTEAFELYQQIHETHPQSVECLRFLLQLCSEVGMERKKEEFETKLQQTTRAQTAMASREAHAAKRTATRIGAETERYDEDRMEKPNDLRQAREVDEWRQMELGEDLLPL